MQEHSKILDEDKAQYAFDLLKTRKRTKTWRDELSPRQYAEGAVAELRNQLLTARGAKRIEKLEMAIRRWELVIEKADGQQR